MNDIGHPLLYRTITLVLTCVAVAFGIAVGTGALEVRRGAKLSPESTPERETPKPYVQRDKAAESLLQNQNVLWVYKFSGGLPKCWAEIDSEGHKQTLGAWASTTQPLFIGDDPADRPILESVEGYVALIAPPSDEQKYRMVCAVTNVEYPQNSKQGFRTVGFREPLEVTLPNLLPPRANGGGDSGRSHFNEGTKPRIIAVGEDAELSYLTQETPSGQSRIVRLKIRFMTVEEIATKR